MTSKITIKDSVDVRGTVRLIEYILSETNIVVDMTDVVEGREDEFPSAMNPYGNPSGHHDQVTITWDQAADVAVLAKVFRFETVMVFEVIVTQLGKLVAAQELYRALA